MHTITLTMRVLQYFLARIPKSRFTLLGADLPYDTLVPAKMLRDPETRRGASGALYSFMTPLETDTGTPSKRNLWTVWHDKQEEELVAKGPSKDDDKTQGWPAFQHEVEMQRLFKDDKMIRPMVDLFPSSDIDEPMMILQPFEQTLWDARNTRHMTTEEIKWIMEGVMLGLGTIHRRGLVHAGLFQYHPWACQ